MKIKITKQEPSAIQEFFSRPLDFSQRVEVKKLQIAGMLCKAMKSVGLNRKELAEKMNIKPSRVTAILDGSQNLTIDTIMRASEALDQKFECALVPKEHEIHWKSFDSARHCEEVINVLSIVEPTVAQFVFNDDLAKTA